MISKVESIGEHSYANCKSGHKNEKSSGMHLSSLKATEKAKQLMKSIITDFPSDEEIFTHNYD